MEMDILKSQKCCFIGRIILLLLAAICAPIVAKGERTGSAPCFDIADSTIQEVDYEYRLFHPELQDRLECVGTMTISLSLPDNVERIQLERTLRRDRNKQDPNNLRFMGLAVYHGSPTSIVAHNVYWGTYFRIRVVFTDGSYEHTNTYAVNDYIDEQDLALLQQQSSITNRDEDVATLTVDNRSLYVEPVKPISLSICDVSGRLLFTGDIESSVSIPLDKATSPIVIVKYNDSTNLITKKLIVK